MCSRVRWAELNTAGVTPTPNPTHRPTRTASAAEQEVCYPPARNHVQSGAAFAGFYCTYENERQI